MSPFRRKEERGGASNAFTNLYIKNLAETVTDDLLKDIFGAIGQLSSAVVMRDEEGKSKVLLHALVLAGFEPYPESWLSQVGTHACKHAAVHGTERCQRGLVAL